jgi:pyroglutamyl-peptidase
MRILVTCFGAFHDFSENPSQNIMNQIKQLAKERKNVEFEWEELDVVFKKVDKFIEHINHEHDLIIHLGVATGAEKIRFELNAHNIKDGKDTSGAIFSNLPIYNGEYKRETSFPIELINDFVEKNKNSTEISNDAGAYLCNYVYFKSLSKLNSNCKVIFIHVADYQNNKKAKSAKEQGLLIYQFLKTFLEKSATNEIH